MIVVSGSGTPYAVIGATYPAGSTCTCTNGTRTVTLKDTSGTGLFKIPYAGTWTVTATNGTDTVSQAVTISVKGQVETVTLDYGLYIIKNGKIQSIGFSTQLRTSYSMTLTQGSGSITLKSTNTAKYSGLAADSKIDVSKYTTLYCKATATKASSVRFGLYSSISSNQPSPVISTELGTAYTTVPTLDLSAMTGEYYVGIDVYANMSTATATVTDFWLE